jgi:predicted DCC family thiol-disulfide oxidoreductase YuxK
MFIRHTFLSSRIRMNNLSLLSNIKRSSSSSTNNNRSVTSDPLVTAWWDSSCPLCLREISLMKKWAKPGTISFIDIASSTSTCPIDRQTMLARFHVQERGGQMVDGAEAFALLWKHIPRMQRLGLYLTNNPKALRIFERSYSNLFLPYLRPALQKIFKWFGL